MVLEKTGGAEKQRRELRKFGLTLGAAFAILGVLLLWRGRGYYIGFLIAAAAFLASGVLMPNALRPVRRIWMAAAEAMGWFMTRVILTILFFVAVTPVGLLGRLFGQRFLDRGTDDSASTYWIERKSPARPGEDYERQF
jgi:hypothetical protein